MDIDNLTVGEVKKLAGLAACFSGSAAAPQHVTGGQHSTTPCIVTTDKRGVVFGYTTNVNARPITLTNARMCLYWSADVGGVFGLAEKGPTKDCKISAVAPSITLEGVTAVLSVDFDAEKAWKNAKVQGR